MTHRSTIIAVTGNDDRHRTVLDRAASLAAETGATVILYDRDADLGPLESPLPTSWSGDGDREQFGDRLDPGELEAAGQQALADQVRVVRAAGVDAYGWLPAKADPEAFAEYAAEQQAGVVVVASGDEDLVSALAPADATTATSDHRLATAGNGGIRVEALPTD